MGFLQDTLEKFRNDETWNTVNKDGTHRFDKEIAWIESMTNEYAVALRMDPDRVMSIMESKRDYSWPNYYQQANFPGISSDKVIGVFDTFEAFRSYATEHWVGFRCPTCGEISPHPEECIHRLNNDGKCDWCAFGLFRSSQGVIVLESGLNIIPIFQPVKKAEIRED